MRNFYSKLFFLLLPALATSQLYVGAGNANSYVYNTGEIVFVTQDVNLQGAPDQDEGNFYLRDQGQLIQGDDSSANSGNGILSVTQKNYMNKWDFHYWASPVGDPKNTSPLDYSGTNGGNTFFYHEEDNNGGLYQIDTEIESTAIPFTASYDSYTDTDGYHYSSYWLYKYVKGNGTYSGWEQLSGNPLNPGEGYTMKGINDSPIPNGIPIDFRGRPNNGTINVDVVDGGLTLVGNPYPSAMNLSYYLLYNSGGDISTCLGTPNADGGTAKGPAVITGNAFFWESDPSVESHYFLDYEGGYGTFTPGTCNSEGTYAPATFVEYGNDGNPIPGTATGDKGNPDLERHFAPVGQGFFVEGIANSVVTAKNQFRVFVKEDRANLSEFKSNGKSSQKNSSKSDKLDSKLMAGGQAMNERGYIVLPEFRLETFINNAYNRTIVGVMYENATLKTDRAMDGFNLSEISTDVSFRLEDTERAVITNYFPYDIEVKLPLKISGNNATNTYRMIISSLNFTPDESIYLHDKQTDEYHDILNQSYEFELEKGTYTDRFEIVFQDEKTLDVEEVEEVKRSFNIYQNNGRAELTVLNPLQTELKEITVFDISGRLLVSKINEGTNEKVVIPSSAWSDGVYIVRVTTKDNIEYSKKVSVRNIK